MTRPVVSTLVAFLVFGSVLAFGQSKTGTVRGVVQDESRASIPGVTITLTNAETKAVVRAITTQTGEYALVASPGIYELKAELPGFQTVTFSGVTLGESQTLQMNFVLRLAGRPRPQQ